MERLKATIIPQSILCYIKYIPPSIPGDFSKHVLIHSTSSELNVPVTAWQGLASVQLWGLKGTPPRKLETQNDTSPYR